VRIGSTLSNEFVQSNGLALDFSKTAIQFPRKVVMGLHGYN